MKKYHVYVVDMDDTLYEERQYVLSGFRAVSGQAGSQLGIGADAAYDFMLQYVNRQGRTGVFDAMMAAFGHAPDHDIIMAWVDAYRKHEPDIEVYPFVLDTLAGLRQTGARVYIVTDGLTLMQQRKFAALGLATHIDRVVYCHETGYPKPDPRALAGLVQHGQEDAVLIGDRPDHDLALAAHLGIDAIRVRTGRFRAQDNEPWVPIRELDSFSDYLERFRV